MIKIIKSLIGILIIVMICTMTSCTAEQGSKCLLVSEESLFNDVYIKNEKIFYDCSITVKNENIFDCDVIFVGDFSVEYDFGIVTRKTLLAFDENGNQIFELKAGETAVFNISFIGTPQTVNQEEKPLKKDRLLPPISIQIIEKT